MKRRRGRQSGAAKIVAPTVTQETPETPPKPIVKDPPSRQCSLCAKEKIEALVACRDCTVRGISLLNYNSTTLN